jgi:hypothetical protein
MDVGTEQRGDASPYDEQGRIEVPGATGWRYLPIEPAGEDALAVTLAGPDDVHVGFTVPDFVSRGEELGEIARLVIRARERMDRSAGLGA